MRPSASAATYARAVFAVACLLASLPADRPVVLAHTPITSPYTFTEHVLPIVRTHCGRCHVKGGVAPMSLLTHADAVPWAESMRIELIAGHMPPWPADGPRTRYQHAQGLSGRELDVLLTWAAGGTPLGPPDRVPSETVLPSAPDDAWRLGPPDVEIPLPEFTLDAATPEATATSEIAVPDAPGGAAPADDRWLRAADLRPGTRSLVRAATVTIATGAAANAPAPVGDVRTLALWIPGDVPVEFPAGTGVRLPRGARLRVQVRYRKTWEHERDAMSDRSVLALYFARDAVASVQALTLAVPAAEAPAGAAPLTVSRELGADVRALAISADPRLVDARATVDAVRPDGSQVNLLSLGAQRGWTRRYWFAEPIVLPRGTRLVARAQPDASTATDAAGTPRPVRALDPATVGFTLDVVPLTH